MSMPSRTGSLDVFLFGRKVGSLDYSSHRNDMRFSYDEEYLSDPGATALSFSLPLSEKTFDSDRTTTFFENLLPPDDVRKRLGPVLHVSRHNIFGFLEALGGDCAGAISLWRPGGVPDMNEMRLLPLSEDEADAVMKSLKKRPLYINGVEGYRISGSGAQSKLIVRIVDGHIELPLFGMPSTHIVKPSVAAYPDSVYNEFFSMRLARAAGLDAAECGLTRIKDEVYYWTKRFDRVFAGGEVKRLHQEDFCQILGISGESKYESEGGPAFVHCMDAIRRMKLGLAQQFAFIDRMIFNFLIGNADAHAKNHSVLYEGGNANLAPVYDAMCTAVYPELSRVNAMSIGSAKKMDGVTRESFAEMAQQAGMKPAAVLRRVDSMSKRIVPAAVQLKEELESEWPCAVYEKILAVIVSNVRKTGGGV